MSEHKTICSIVREMEDFDQNGKTQFSKYVSENMRENIEKTEAYLNSKHTSGDTDYMGREKPFKNICYPAVNIWFRATDIDSKQLVIRADDNSTFISALLATIKLQEWMRTVNLGQVLNTWGLSLATHGSSILKIVDKGDELSIEVMDWNNMIVDPIDFDGNIKIQKLWYTPAQLKQMENYNKEMVEDLIENPTTRETSDGMQKDNRANYIPVYEVHGNLPLSLLTGHDEDDDTYVQQMHVVSFIAKKENSEEYEDYTLYSGREKQDPYFITHLIKKDGKTYSGGAVYNLFEAQWMINDTQKMIRDQLLLASKIFFQGSDKEMAGKSFFTDIDNGEYLEHKPGEPMTRVNNSPDTVAMTNFQNDWQSHGNVINGIADAMVSQAKSGTAWRQTQAELQEAHSLFELMVENKGLYLTEIFKRYVIPFFKRQLKNNNAISNYLEAHQIKQIDAIYLPAEVNRRLENKKKSTILSGQIYDVTQEGQDIANLTSEVQGELKGNQRFIKPSEVNWEKEFKNLNFDNLELDATGESRDIQAKMATLQTALSFIVSLNGRPMTEDERLIFNKLLGASGTVSPLELSLNQGSASQPQPQQPIQATQQPMAAMQM